MKVSTVAQMRSMDAGAVKTYGIQETVLMENAGMAAYTVLNRQLGGHDKKYVVFCGGGNNGGDGFVVARKIFSNNGAVKVFLLSDPEKFKGCALENLKIIKKMPISIHRVESADTIRSSLYYCDGVVDAIFGTGLDREVKGLYKEIIEAINLSAKPVFSLDIPSGVNGETGQVMGCAVQAEHTITFGLPKLGNLLHPGAALGGTLHVTHISFPPPLYDQDSLLVSINEPSPLPPRIPHGHKGSFGNVLFIAGASSYFGAPYFAALSFLKAGGGYSRLAAPESMIPHLAGKGSEIVFAPQKETPLGSLSMDNMENLFLLAEKQDMVVLGPGLSLDPETQKLVQGLTQKISKPLLLDGDGITAICENLDLIRNREGATILTPHLGEMERITKTPKEDILKNPVKILQDTAGELNAIVVLKGAHTLIGLPDKRVFINLTGNSGMATAGSGDVLAGTIPAMYGLGLDLETAVQKGVLIHGLAGDLAAACLGQDGITAQDILEYLPDAVQEDRQGFSILPNLI